MFLLVWPIGYALTYTALPDFAFQYFAVSFLALLSCGFLLSALKAPLADSLPVWVILWVFVFGYFVEFYVLVLDPSILEAFFAPTKVTQIDITAYFDSYMAATSAFLATSLISIIYLKRGFSQSTAPNGSSYNAPDDRALWQLGGIFALIVLVSSVLAYKFNLIGSGDRDLLPFHLEGLVDYVRLVTAPLLIILIIQLAIVNNRRNWIIAGVAMLLTFALFRHDPAYQQRHLCQHDSHFDLFAVNYWCEAEQKANRRRHLTDTDWLDLISYLPILSNLSHTRDGYRRVTR